MFFVRQKGRNNIINYLVMKRHLVELLRKKKETSLVIVELLKESVLIWSKNLSGNSLWAHED